MPSFLQTPPHDECDYRSGGLRWNIDRICSLTYQEKRQEPDKAKSVVGREEARLTGRGEVCGWLLGTEMVLAFCLPHRGISCTPVAFCGTVKAAQEHIWVPVPRIDTIEKKGGFIMHTVGWGRGCFTVLVKKGVLLRGGGSLGPGLLSHTEG